RQRCDAFPKRRSEIEFSTHGAFGDVGHQRPGPGMVGEQVDLLGGDEGGVHIQQHQAALAHAGSMRAPLGTTVTPVSVTVKPRERSSSGSTPMLAPSATMTFLSKMALCTRAWRCTDTPSSSTESCTNDQELTRVPGEMTEPCTSPPEM